MKPGYTLLSEFKHSITQTYKLGELNRSISASRGNYERSLPDGMRNIIKKGIGENSGVDAYKKASNMFDLASEDGAKNIEKALGRDSGKSIRTEYHSQSLSDSFKKLKAVARANLEDQSPDARSNLLTYMTQEVRPFLAMANDISYDSEGRSQNIRGVSSIDFKKNLEDMVNDPRAGEKIKKHGMERMLMSAALGIPESSSDQEFELRGKEILSPINTQLSREVNNSIAENLSVTGTITQNQMNDIIKKNSATGQEPSSRPTGQAALNALGKNTEIVSNDLNKLIGKKSQESIANKGNVNSNPEFLSNMREVMTNTIILKKAMEERRGSKLTEIIAQRSQEISRSTGLEGKELYDRVIKEVATSPSYNASKIYPDIAREVKSQISSTNVDYEEKTIAGSVTGHYVSSWAGNNDEYNDKESLQAVKLYEEYFPQEKSLIDRIKETSTNIDPKSLETSHRNNRSQQSMNAFTSALMGTDPNAGVKEWNQVLGKIAEKDVHNQQYRLASVAGQIMVRDGIVSAAEMPKKPSPTKSVKMEATGKESFLNKIKESVSSISKSVASVVTSAPSMALDGIKGSIDKIKPKKKDPEVIKPSINDINASRQESIEKKTPVNKETMASPQVNKQEKDTGAKMGFSDDIEQQMKRDGTWAPMDELIRYGTTKSFGNADAHPAEQDHSMKSVSRLDRTVDMDDDITNRNDDLNSLGQNTRLNDLNSLAESVAGDYFTEEAINYREKEHPKNDLNKDRKQEVSHSSGMGM